jgi:hypothetical protein
LIAAPPLPTTSPPRVAVVAVMSALVGVVTTGGVWSSAV